MLTLAADGKHIEGWKYGVHRFGPATYRSLSPGGGGFGDPKTRDPERVLRDVRDGVVSAAAAERDYGVAITIGRPRHRRREDRGAARLRSSSVIARYRQGASSPAAGNRCCADSSTNRPSRGLISKMEISPLGKSL
jgi:hypothetical protein